MIPILSRLWWYRPLDRSASVLHAIEKAGLPLVPPDDDVEEYSPTRDDVGFREVLDSEHALAFLSHTSADETTIRENLLPTLELFFASIFLMNIKMAIERRGPNIDIIAAYKRRILHALGRSEWVVVVLSRSAVTSDWVRFELGWALRYHEHGRIIALILDGAARAAFAPVLHFVRSVSVPMGGPATERRITRVLRRSGVKTPGSSNQAAATGGGGRR